MADSYGPHGASFQNLAPPCVARWWSYRWGATTFAALRQGRFCWKRALVTWRVMGVKPKKERIRFFLRKMGKHFSFFFWWFWKVCVKCSIMFYDVPIFQTVVPHILFMWAREVAAHRIFIYIIVYIYIYIHIHTNKFFSGKMVSFI